MKIKRKIFLLYTYVHIRKKVELKMCTYKNVAFQMSDIFMFICIAFSFFQK